MGVYIGKGGVSTLTVPGIAGKRGMVCASAKKDAPKKKKASKNEEDECEGHFKLKSCFWSLADSSNAEQSLLDLLAMSWNRVKVQSDGLPAVRADNLAAAIISARMTHRLFVQRAGDSDRVQLGSTRWEFFVILREMAAADVSGYGSESAIANDLTALALEAWLHLLQNFFVAAVSSKVAKQHPTVSSCFAAVSQPFLNRFSTVSLQADRCAIVCQLLCFIVDRSNKVLVDQSAFAANNLVTKTIKW